jgi:hypothetical protein
MTIQPEGIQSLGIPFDIYADHEGTNATELIIVDTKSLAHAKHRRDGGPEKESDCRDFGRAFHGMLLEDRQDFVVHPLVYPATPKKKGDPVEMKPWTWTANYCKDWAKAQEKEVLSHAESDALMGMIAGLRKNEELSDAIKGARNEVSIFAEKNGWKYKGRIDTLTASGGPLIDFKSTTNARPDKFVRQAYDAGWFLQTAFYLDLCKMCGDRRDEVWLVAVEKTAPYAHSIIKLKDGPVSFIGLGRARYLCALSSLKQAVKTNCWPSYKSIEAELVAPAWALKELEQAV